MANLSGIITPTNVLTATSTNTVTNKTINIANNTLTGVQPTLVSGTNIKTVSGQSLLGSEQMQVGVDPIEFFVSDCNSTNAVLHEDVPEVEDWVSSKFLFDGTAWALNPDWIDPATIVEEPVPTQP
jgi:hypothetical protein